MHNTQIPLDQRAEPDRLERVILIYNEEKLSPKLSEGPKASESVVQFTGRCHGKAQEKKTIHGLAATGPVKPRALRTVRAAAHPWQPLHCPQALCWTPVPDQFCTSKNLIRKSQVYSPKASRETILIHSNTIYLEIRKYI